MLMNASDLDINLKRSSRARTLLLILKNSKSLKANSLNRTI